jgi:hypothetical protein
MHPTHNKALSSAYDVDLMSAIQIDDLHEGDAAYLRCGLLLNHRLGRVYHNGNRRLFSQSLCPFFKRGHIRCGHMLAVLRLELKKQIDHLASQLK